MTMLSPLTWIERVARGVGYAAVLAALVIAVVHTVRPALLPQNTGDTAPRIDAGTADSAATMARTIRRYIVAHAAGGDMDGWPTFGVTMHAIPSANVRGVLSAARSAGIPIVWHDATGMHTLALDASSVPGPHAFTVVSVSARASAWSPGVANSATADTALAMSVALRDDGGLLDSTMGGNATLRMQAAALSGNAHALVLRNGQPIAEARVAVPDSAVVRRVRVFGAVGWESKFVAAALEESGWSVDGVVAVNPNVRVRTGTAAALDTGHYAAAVVLDSGSVSARVLRVFAAQGGGVILAGRALRDASLSALAGVTVRGDRPAIAGALLTDSPLRGVRSQQLTPSREFIVLHAEGSAPMIGVKREGAGRVLTSAYESTWRWRMEGAENAPADHRVWWSRLVSTVAYASPVATGATVNVATRRPWPGDAAPVADLHAKLGASTTLSDVSSAAPTIPLPPIWLLMCIAVAAFLTEWMMRRLRGAR